MEKFEQPQKVEGVENLESVNKKILEMGQVIKKLDARIIELENDRERRDFPNGRRKEGGSVGPYGHWGDDHDER